MAAEIQTVRFVWLKSLIAYLITHPAVGKFIGAIYSEKIPSGDLSVDTSVGASDAVKAMLFWRMYESAEIQFVRRFLKDIDVVELGSSLGVVSCHIAQKIGENRLFCVEANPALHQTIWANLKWNAPLARVSVISAALDYSGPQNSMVQLGLGKNNLTSKIVPYGADGINVSVNSIQLLDLIHKNNISDFSLVCDIEGAEIGLLVCDKAALTKCRQIIIELHAGCFNGRHYEVDDLVRIICDDLGFMLRARRAAVCVFERAAVS